MNNMFCRFLFLVALMAPCASYAIQEFRVKDGDTVTIKVSSQELTRLTIEGEGRLDKVWTTAGILEIQPDITKGEAYIRPINNAPAAFSFFVSDDLGFTYTIVAEQYDIPSETVVLQPVSARRSETNDYEYRTRSYVDQVKELVKGMALGEAIDGYYFDDEEVVVPLWKETEIVLRRLYSGQDLLGEIYTIKNTSDLDMEFHESEFLDFGVNVQAVSLERLSIGVNETTFLYVVRGKGSN